MTPERAAAPPVTLRDLIVAFTWLSLSTYGGAQSAAIRREIVLRRRWLDDDEFLEMRALAQIAPGANSPNLAILIGMRFAGTAGACAAFVAAVLPGVLILFSLGLLSLNPHFGSARGILAGCACAAVGASLANALEMSAPYLRRGWLLAIVALTAATALLTHLSLGLTLLIFVPLAMWVAQKTAAVE